jgi:hypothetical protein
MVDEYFLRRILLTIFLFFLSILLTFIIMAFLFPVINPIMSGDFLTKALITFIASNLVANYIILLNISFRYGIPFRGENFWEWLMGDKKIGTSMKSSIIGAAILIGIFILIVFMTFGLRHVIQSFLLNLHMNVEMSHASNFLLDMVPAYVITNIFFVLFFLRNKEIALYKASWNPIRIKFDTMSSAISLAFFLLVSSLICVGIWFGLLPGIPLSF